MSRLLVSFCLALGSHLYLLQADFWVNEPSPPQLISDRSVTVTLNQNKQQQADLSTQDETQAVHKPKQVKKQEDTAPLHPQSLTKDIPTPQKRQTLQPLAIQPRVHKIKKSIDPSPEVEQICDTPPIAVKKKQQQLPESFASAPQPQPAPEAATASVIKARPLYQHNPKPEYPGIARRRGWEGVVAVLVEVTEEGKAVTVRLHKSSGYKILDSSALRAVKQWRFLAGTTNGKPTTTTVLIPVHFRLHN